MLLGSALRRSMKGDCAWWSLTGTITGQIGSLNHSRLLLFPSALPPCFLPPFLPPLIQLLTSIPDRNNHSQSLVAEVLRIFLQQFVFSLLFSLCQFYPFPRLLALSPSLSFPPSLSLGSVKQQGPCDSKLRKRPIKENMYFTGESEGGMGVCRKAKERVIWRCLSWTGQFPVSGTGQKYPETQKSSTRGKDTPLSFSCDLLHSANYDEFWGLQHKSKTPIKLFWQSRVKLYPLFHITQCPVNVSDESWRFKLL